MIYVAPIS